MTVSLRTLNESTDSISENDVALPALGFSFPRAPLRKHSVNKRTIRKTTFIHVKTNG